MMKPFYYSNIDDNMLCQLMKNKEISSSLAYIVCAKQHEDLEVTPKKHSIELSNNEISINIILYVGFESDDYYTINRKNNLHIIAFNEIVPSMIEFTGLNVKFVDKTALLFTVLALSKNPILTDLHHLRKIK